MKIQIYVSLLNADGGEVPLIKAMAGDIRDGIVLHREVRILPGQEGSEDYEGMILTARRNREKVRWEVEHPQIYKKNFAIMWLHNGEIIPIASRSAVSEEQLAKDIGVECGLVGYKFRESDGTLSDIVIKPISDHGISSPAELDATLKKAREDMGHQIKEVHRG